MRRSLQGIVTGTACLAGALGVAGGAWAQSPAISISQDAGGMELGYVKLVLLLASVSLAPALLAVLTSFARIVVVLFFLRAGLGAQEIPPNYVMVGRPNSIP